jgi:hypothetical protein
VRRTRQISSWTAAALVAGVAAGSGYFAHAAAMPTVWLLTRRDPGQPPAARQLPDRWLAARR